MAEFRTTDGTTIHFDQQGSGDAVILLHGFAANTHITWVRPGIFAALVQRGMAATAPDHRGHGRSDAPVDVAAYTLDAIVGDVVELMDALHIDRAHFLGYSIGSRIATEIAVRHKGRVASLVLGGVGSASMDPKRIWGDEEIAAGLEAPRPEDVTHPRARAFRSFADATGSDRLALAAFQRAMIDWPPPEPELVSAPALVVVGDQDTIAGAAAPLAARIAGGEASTISGNHMNAVIKADFATEVVGFFERHKGT